MILVTLIAVLFVGGLACWLSERFNPNLPRVIALLTVLLDFALMFSLWALRALQLGGSIRGALDFPFWYLVLPCCRWLSVLLLMLTAFLGVVAIGAAWDEVQERSGFFYFNLLWTLAGVVGVFTALDLFLFFFFWEVMLIPMYLIIAIWGHENKNYAAMKFFIFTQVTGMMMLVSILVLAYFHYLQLGSLSFNYHDLLNVSLTGEMGMWVMLGFFISFSTKLPACLPFLVAGCAQSGAHRGSVILAGVLLKTGLRFDPVCSAAVSRGFDGLRSCRMTLAAVSILYCAKVAFAQDDIKRLIAYTSVSHMGFVTLGIYAWNEQALQGAVMTMLAHGLSAAALFMLAGGLQHRIHTRNMPEMGGFWPKVPKMTAVAIFFSVAALGMPGLGNFIGEFLALIGAFQANVTLTVVAAFGLILASVYSLWVLQKVFQGEYSNRSFDDSHLTDLSRRGCCTL